MNSLLDSTMASSALAFRGYNITNLGRTPELLAIPAYRTVIEEELRRYGAICAETIGKPVDLVRRVVDRSEAGIEDYADAVALIVAVEVAHLRLLREVHGVDYANARLSYGYSLGEMMAVCAGGAFAPEDLVRVPLAMAADSASLARDATMGILFSRGPAIPEAAVAQLCVQITSQGTGVIGMSAILSPNTYLLVGQGDTVQEFKQTMAKRLPEGTQLRLNSHRWPPLHTPIVRQRNIPDRAAVMLGSLPGGVFPPHPPVVSLVTGRRNYDETSAREVLRDWIDHPQRLWDAMCETLAADVKTVIHIGPEPNLIPATFARLSENIRQQTGGRSLESYRMRAVSGMLRRPWLAALLPARAALLRAPFLRHIVLEDWLIENAPQT